jgi:hypothetical protein
MRSRNLFRHDLSCRNHFQLIGLGVVHVPWRFPAVFLLESPVDPGLEVVQPAKRAFPTYVTVEVPGLVSINCK